MVKSASYFFVIIVAVISWMADNHALSRVIREDGLAYIVDTTGERWDMTQAESIWFNPEGFHFGLGRNTFTPLDDSYLSDDVVHVPQDLRVLGVVKNLQAQAYSISRLRGHQMEQVD